MLAWGAVALVQIRADLLVAKTQLSTVRAEAVTDPVAASAAFQRAAVAAAAAREAATNPVIRLVARVPFAGDPVRTVRGLAGAAATLTDSSVGAALDRMATVSGEGLLSSPDTVNLVGLGGLAGPLTDASTSLAASRREVAALPTAGWLPPVRDARAEFLTTAADLSGELDAARDLAALLPPLLGADGPRRYFVAFQNTAETRGSGGLIGAYVILRAEKGRLSVERRGSNVDLRDPPESAAALMPPEFVRRYQGLGGTTEWLEANLSPHFPYTGQVETAMWRAGTGEQLDGAIALDPPAMAAIVRATGPVPVPGRGPLGADELVRFIERDEYALPSAQDPGVRKELLQVVAGAALDRLTSGRADRTVLVDGLRTAVRQRTLQVWSRFPAEEQVLARYPVAGVVPTEPPAPALLFLNNSNGGKLDTYLERRLTSVDQPCGKGGTQQKLVVTVRNTAPASGLPAYVTVQNDIPEPPRPPTSAFLGVSVLLPPGRTVESVTIDRTPLGLFDPKGAMSGDPEAEEFAYLDTERGRAVATYYLEIASGQQRQLTVLTTCAAAAA